MKIILEQKGEYGTCALIYDDSDSTYCVLIKNHITTACYAYFSLASAEKAYNEMCATINE